MNPSSKLIEVLHDDDSTRDAGEKLFTLRKMSSHHHHPSRSASRESQQQQQRSISKVSPEKTRQQQQQRSQSYQRSPLSITIRNEKTENALRRLDNALTALSTNNPKRKTTSENTNPAMAVIRNVDSGVDIILTHGLLSSKILSKNQVQYTVSVNMDQKSQLVAQKIMQQPLTNGNRTINSSLKNVTESDLDILVKCGIAFLEAHDRKSGRKPVPSALAPGNNGNPGTPGVPSLDIVDSSNGSLDDLEKVFILPTIIYIYICVCVCVCV